MASGAGYGDGYAPLAEVFATFLRRPTDLHLIMDYLYRILIDVRTANAIDSIQSVRAPEHHPVGLASHVPRPHYLTLQEDVQRTGRLLWERTSDDNRCSIAVVRALNGLDLESLWKYWSRKWAHTVHPWARRKQPSIIEDKEIEVVAGRAFILNCALLYLNLDPNFGDGQMAVLERLVTAQPGYEDYTAFQNMGKREERKTNLEESLKSEKHPFFELNNRLEKYQKYPYTLNNAPSSRPAPLPKETQDVVQNTPTPQMRANHNIFARSSNVDWDHSPIDYRKGAPWGDERNAAITSVIDQFIAISQNVAQVFIRYPSPTLHQYRAAYRQTLHQLGSAIENPFSEIDKKVRKDLADDFHVKGAWDFIWLVAVSLVRSRDWRRPNQAGSGTRDLRGLLFATILDTATGYHSHPDQDSSQFIDPEGVVRSAIRRKYGTTIEQREKWFRNNLLRVSFTRLDLDHYDLFARHGVPYELEQFADEAEQRFYRHDTGTMDRYNPRSIDDGEDLGFNTSSPSSEDFLIPYTDSEDDSPDESGGESEEGGDGPSPDPPARPPSSSGSDSDGDEGGAGRNPSTIFSPVWAPQGEYIRLPPPPSPPPAPRSLPRGDNDGLKDAPSSTSRGRRSRRKSKSEVDGAYRPGREDDDEAEYIPSAPPTSPAQRRSPSRRPQRRGKKGDERDKLYRPSKDDEDDEDDIPSLQPPAAAQGRKSPVKVKGKNTGDENKGSSSVPSPPANRRSPSRRPQSKGRKGDEGDKCYSPDKSDSDDDEDDAPPVRPTPRGRGSPQKRNGSEGIGRDNSGDILPPAVPAAPESHGSSRKTKGKDDADKPYRPGKESDEDEDFEDLSPLPPATTKSRGSPHKTEGRDDARKSHRRAFDGWLNGKYAPRHPPPIIPQPRDRSRAFHLKRENRDTPYHPSDSDPEDENFSSDGLITDDDDEDLTKMLLGGLDDETGPLFKRSSETDSLGDFLSPGEKEIYDKFNKGLLGTVSLGLRNSARQGKKRPSPPSTRGEEPARKKSKKSAPSRPGPFTQSSSSENEDKVASKKGEGKKIRPRHSSPTPHQDDPEAVVNRVLGPILNERGRAEEDPEEGRIKPRRRSS
ncbi:hypothetical protein BDV96DRAFT_596058 [Lophiotrema nucula]|uniref:Uncharacterized protein n=1 Tax=Lophiotrema nucula TaxID=690887 RepID=A0A6A5ZIQ6_9PLEO|nr:hypothetical protein BDV96DRAFT_596058 [Lophiotrema nucula]